MQIDKIMVGKFYSHAERETTPPKKVIHIVKSIKQKLININQINVLLTTLAFPMLHGKFFSSTRIRLGSKLFWHGKRCQSAT